MYHPNVIEDLAKQRQHEYLEEAHRERLIKQARAGKQNWPSVRALISRWLRVSASSQKPQKQSPATELAQIKARAQ